MSPFISIPEISKGAFSAAMSASYSILDGLNKMRPPTNSSVDPKLVISLRDASMPLPTYTAHSRVVNLFP